MVWGKGVCILGKFSLLYRDNLNTFHKWAEALLPWNFPDWQTIMTRPLFLALNFFIRGRRFQLLPNMSMLLKCFVLFLNTALYYSILFFLNLTLGKPRGWSNQGQQGLLFKICRWEGLHTDRNEGEFCADHFVTTKNVTKNWHHPLYTSPY